MHRPLESFAPCPTRRARPRPLAAACLAVTLGIALAGGCVDADAQQGTGAPGEAASASLPSPVSLHMAGRYGRATELRDALVRGDLGEARTIARDLARPARLEGLPASARPHVLGVPLHAQEVADATTLLDASSAFGSLMAACGACHGATGVRLSTPSAPLPAPPGRHGAMREHARAVETMWEGLLLGATPRFDEGARQLAEAPLTAPERTAAPDLRALAERARSAARASTRGADLAARAEQFGIVLSTCAECHATARR